MQILIFQLSQSIIDIRAIFGVGRLTSSDRLAEDVLIIAVVVAELEFGDVQRQILGADLVECADYAAFEDRPEALDRVRVDRADDVLTLAVVNDTVWELLIKPAIAAPLVSAKQANLLGHRAAYKAPENVAAHAVDNARNNLSLALDSTNDRNFARADPASSSASAALVLVPVLGEASDEGFIYLDDAHQLAEVFVGKASAHPVAHVPSRAIRAEAHHSMHLQRADPFLAGQHQVDDTEPLAERLIGVLKDRSGDMREAVVGAGRRAGVTEPVPRHRAVLFDFGIAASRADDELGPAVLREVEAASVLVREGFFPFGDRHLADLRLLLLAGHLALPFDRREYATPN
jgi:hypothetical protein